MSKITDDVLTQYGTGCFIQQWPSKGISFGKHIVTAVIKGLKSVVMIMTYNLYAVKGHHYI